MSEVQGHADRSLPLATCPNQTRTSCTVPSQTLETSPTALWDRCLGLVSCKATFNTLAPSHDALGVAVKWCSARAEGTRELFVAQPLVYLERVSVPNGWAGLGILLEEGFKYWVSRSASGEEREEKQGLHNGVGRILKMGGTASSQAHSNMDSTQSSLEQHRGNGVRPGRGQHG